MTSGNGEFICASEKMRRIRENIERIADTDVTILIQGESGVGKEVAARCLHRISNRRDKPFVKVHCAALPDELLESELFGYERGAFTGAYNRKPGRFELANGGIIFLDEIGEMGLAQQVKLLQVLQDGEFARLGGREDVRVNVRVLAATNRNLEEAVKGGRFRGDLYYRLNVVNITIPPLRERREEIPVLVEYFWKKFQREYQRDAKPFPASLLNAFMRHDWMGNVRELANLLQRFAILQDAKEILREMTSLEKGTGGPGKKEARGAGEGRSSLKQVQDGVKSRVEAKFIFNALQRTNWNRREAAEFLDIGYKTLLSKIKRYEIGKSSAPHP